MSKKTKKAQKKQKVQEKQKVQAEQKAQEKQKVQAEQKVQEKQKQESWNQGGKKRKQKLSQEEERLGHLLDQAEAEELLKISGIHSEVSMPLPNREKLAWSVIDKADLADEEELKRREEFQRMLRRKKMTRIAIVSSAAVVLLLVLAWIGVFDYFRSPAYEDYYVLGGNCYSAGDSVDPMEVFQERELPEGVEISVSPLATGSRLDMDKLDTTAYYALAEYCEANDYAVGEYKIATHINMRSDDRIEELEKDTEPEYRMIDGKLYVKCTVLGSCLDYHMEDEGMTWRECIDEDGWSGARWRFEHSTTPWFNYTDATGNIGEVIPVLTSPFSLDDPANTCYVCLTLYVCIE